MGYHRISERCDLLLPGAPAAEREGPLRHKHGDDVERMLADVSFEQVGTSRRFAVDNRRERRDMGLLPLRGARPKRRGVGRGPLGTLRVTICEAHEGVRYSGQSETLIASQGDPQKFPRPLAACQKVVGKASIVLGRNRRSRA